MKELVSFRSFNALYKKIKSVLKEARNKSYRAVNFIMVETYWNIGLLIVEEEQKGKNRAGYGEYLLKHLSQKLQIEFEKGFDESNLRNIRLFYLRFPIRDALRHELSWTHYRLLMRVDDENARAFYIKEAIAGNWSTRQLDRQINSFYYERLLASKNKHLIKKTAHKKDEKSEDKIQGHIKDPYVLEFLGLRGNSDLRESHLEQLLIDHLQNFLLELGRGFSFVARQQRVSTETQDFFIDIVFYNYLLNCFVLIDLKIGKLIHQDIGQMDMYVRIYEDKIKPKEANPTIGLILCSDKDETMVRYSVLRDNKHLFASKYKLYLPSEKELQEEIKKDREIIETQRKLEGKY